jgi:hypothetical protein
MLPRSFLKTHLIASVEFGHRAYVISIPAMSLTVCNFRFPQKFNQSLTLLVIELTKLVSMTQRTACKVNVANKETYGEFITGFVTCHLRMVRRPDSPVTWLRLVVRPSTCLPLISGLCS